MVAGQGVFFFFRKGEGNPSPPFAGWERNKGFLCVAMPADGLIAASALVFCLRARDRTVVGLVSHPGTLVVLPAPNDR